MKILVIAVLVLAASEASAQVFPPENQWYPLNCRTLPMTDLVGDTANFTQDRDLVGPDDVAGMHAVDSQYLYLRMRLEKDPAPLGVFDQAAWGFEFDIDGTPNTYEVLILVDNTAGGGNVLLMHNTTTAMGNNPADPAETVVATHPIAGFARSVPAPSNYNVDGDYWLEFGMSWAELTPLGFNRNTRIRAWAGSSSANNALNGDLACHDGRSGAPNLDLIISDPTTPDPIVDTDGDGFTDAQEVAAGSDPNDPNSVPVLKLAGGGGCSTTNGSSWLALIGWLLFVRRRVRSPKP